MFHGMVCALVLAANDAYGPVFCFWDEPDNYLAPSEVGHFVLALRKAFRSEEHTSELQSQSNLVCRLLLEKKKKNKRRPDIYTKNRKQHTSKHFSFWRTIRHHTIA